MSNARGFVKLYEDSGVISLKAKTGLGKKVDKKVTEAVMAIVGPAYEQKKRERTVHMWGKKLPGTIRPRSWFVRFLAYLGFGRGEK